MNFTSLCSGSSGNCLYIAGGATAILVDAGCSCRYLERALAAIDVQPAQISALFITHEHSDHISGAARVSRRFGIPLYASELTWENLPFRDDFMPWDRHLCRGPLEIGELAVDFFALSHDAAQPTGLVVRQAGSQAEQSVGVVTDTGCFTASMLDALRGVDGLVLEANHSLPMLARGNYPAYLKRRISGDTGHLANPQAADLLRRVGEKVQAVLLAHLSSQNNDPSTALHEFKARLAETGAALGCDISVALRNQPHPLISLR